MKGGNISFLLLPTLCCNCRCDYCLQRHDEGEWSTRQSRFILESIFEFAKDAGFESLRLDWQGGEPLLLADEYWNYVLPLAGDLAASYGLILTQAMQSNLILYRSSLKALIHAHLRGMIGSSFELSHSRKIAGGGNFTEEWIKAYNRASDDQITAGILSLINGEVIAAGAQNTLVRLHDEFSIRKIRFLLPCASAQTGRGLMIDAAEAGRFLSDAYLMWSQMGRDEWILIKPFASIEKFFLGDTGVEQICFFAPDCTRSTLTILPDGGVTLCGNYACDPSKRYGNIFETKLADLYRGDKRREIAAAILSMRSEDCESCRYLVVCNGGCPARSDYDKDTRKSRYHYCESYKMLFRTIERNLLTGSSRTSGTSSPVR